MNHNFFHIFNLCPNLFKCFSAQEIYINILTESYSHEVTALLVIIVMMKVISWYKE